MQLYYCTMTGVFILKLLVWKLSSVSEDLEAMEAFCADVVRKIPELTLYQCCM